ncbi:MAG TPA: PepSY domain-containing protein [Methanobacteriaceae archaeon]|nr:PepSY domain-containing protein [Methanobacteriaceae archaeon]
MDLPENWEKRALILVGVVVLIIVIYAFNPFASKANVTTGNQTSSNPQMSTMPFDQSSTNSSGNTTINVTNNGTFQLTAEQAKNIAAQARPGYTAGDPTQETIVIDGVKIGVWKVPLTKTGMPSKTLYIDITSGKIVKES